MEIFQLISTILIIINIVLCIDLYKNIAHKRLYLVPLFVYLIHTFVFYIVVGIFKALGIYPENIPNFTIWSSIIRLQAIITIFFFFLIIGKYDRKIIQVVNKIRGKLLWKSG